MKHAQDFAHYASENLAHYPELHIHFEELDAVLAANPDIAQAILEAISSELQKQIQRKQRVKNRRWSLAIDAATAQRKALKVSGRAYFNELGAFEFNDAAVLLRRAADCLESISRGILSEIPKYARTFKRLAGKSDKSRGDVVEFPSILKPTPIPERFRESAPEAIDLSFVKTTGPMSGKAAASDMAEFDRALGLTKGAGGESPPDRPAAAAQADETGRGHRQNQPTSMRSRSGRVRDVEL
jgi:hypothetical protein